MTINDLPITGSRDRWLGNAIKQSWGCPEEDVLFSLFISLCQTSYPIVCPSVRLSVCPSVRPSVFTWPLMSGCRDRTVTTCRWGVLTWLSLYLFVSLSVFIFLSVYLCRYIPARLFGCKYSPLKLKPLHHTTRRPLPSILVVVTIPTVRCCYSYGNCRSTVVQVVGCTVF